MRVSMKYCTKYLKERKNILEAALYNKQYYDNNNNNPTNISTNPIPKILQPLPPYLF